MTITRKKPERKAGRSGPERKAAGVPAAVAGATDSAASLTVAGTRAEGVARRFFALSDPTRLRVVELLTRGERCVCDLVEAVGAAQSRLSFHLRTLKDAGLVRDERRGRWIYYSVDPEVLEEMASYLGVGAEAARECCGPGQRPADEEGCCG